MVVEAHNFAHNFDTPRLKLFGLSISQQKVNSEHYITAVLYQILIVH